MSNTEDTAELSEIKGKPVDAIGHMVFQINFEHFQSPFCIEKIFGLVDEKTNVVFKFKLVVREDGPRKIKFKLVYVSEEAIDCKINIENGPSEILEHLTIGDEVKKFKFEKETLLDYPKVYFHISILVITTTSMKRVFAKKFNDPSTSDFTVKCQDKQFYVHQMVLQEKSEYFEAILSNDCIEKRDKMLNIVDFQPNVVEILLQYLYNGAVSISASLSWTDLICLMKIADKYNVNELFDAMDSFISQRLFLILNRPDNDKNRVFLTRYLRKIENIQAPKSTTMIYKWRSTEKGRNTLDDNQWSNMIQKSLSFATLGGFIVGRNDYQDWVQQHISWCLCCEIVRNKRNNFVVLVGPVGEMKGAVKCSPI